MAVRQMDKMEFWGRDVVTPHLAPDHGLRETISSTFLVRLPPARQAPPAQEFASEPWRLNRTTDRDRAGMRAALIDDGVLHFTRAASTGRGSSRTPHLP
jgi:hypothetical protein